MNLATLTTDQLFELHHQLSSVCHVLAVLCTDYLSVHPYGAQEPAYLAISARHAEAYEEANRAYAAYADRRTLERATEGDDWDFARAALLGATAVAGACNYPMPGGQLCGRAPHGTDHPHIAPNDMWTEYLCEGCGAAYSALPFDAQPPHRCFPSDVEARWSAIEGADD